MSLELALHPRSVTLGKPHTARLLPLCKVLIIMALTSVACYNVSGTVWPGPAPSQQGTAGVTVGTLSGKSSCNMRAGQTWPWHSSARMDSRAEGQGTPHHEASAKGQEGRRQGPEMESVPSRAAEESQMRSDDQEETAEDDANGKGDGRGPPWRRVLGEEVALSTKRKVVIKTKK